MDQREELHFLWPNDLVNYVRVVAITHVDKVLVRRDERLLAQLRLEVNPQRLDPVPHGVGGLHARQILQELRGDAHLWRFRAVVLLRVLVALTVVVGDAFVVAQATAGLGLIGVPVAADATKLTILRLSRASAAIDALLAALAGLDHAAAVRIVALGG